MSTRVAMDKCLTNVYQQHNDYKEYNKGNLDEWEPRVDSLRTQIHSDRQHCNFLEAQKCVLYEQFRSIVPKRSDTYVSRHVEIEYIIRNQKVTDIKCFRISHEMTKLESKMQQYIENIQSMQKEINALNFNIRVENENMLIKVQYLNSVIRTCGMYEIQWTGNSASESVVSSIALLFA